MKNKILILALLFTVGSVFSQDWVPSSDGNGFTSTDGQGISVVDWYDSGTLAIIDNSGNQMIVTATGVSSFPVSTDSYNQGGHYYSSWAADFGDPSGNVWITPTPAQALAFLASAGIDSSYYQNISPLLASTGLSGLDPAPPAPPAPPPPPTALVDILSAKIGETLTAALQVLAALLGIAVILVSLFIALKLIRNAFYKT